MQRMLGLVFCLTAAIGIILGGSSANAGIVTYPDYASWSSAVSGITTVTIPDPALMRTSTSVRGTRPSHTEGLSSRRAPPSATATFSTLGVSLAVIQRCCPPRNRPSE